MASGPETKLILRMRKAAQQKYGDRLVIVKQHGGPYATAGVADLLCCFDGTFVAVEVKAPDSAVYTGKNSHTVTVKQQAFLDAVGTAGGFPFVCTSVEEFLSVLHDIEDMT